MELKQLSFQELRKDFRKQLPIKPKQKIFVPFSDNNQDGIFDITIKRFYTDFNGVEVAKTDGLIPAVLKVNLPVWMFGVFDRNGGSFIAQQVVPLPSGVQTLGTFIWGNYVPNFIQLSGVNDIQNKIFPGDIVTVYTDNINAPSAFVWMVQSSTAAALQSIMLDCYSKNPLHIRGIKYVTDSIDQFNRSLHMTRATKLGKYVDNDISLSVFRSPDYKINDIVDIDLQFENSPYNGINTVLNYTTDRLQFVFDCVVTQ